MPGPKSKNSILSEYANNIIPWYHFEPDCSCIKHNLLTIKQNKGGANSRHKHYQLIERKIFIFHFLCLRIDVNNFYFTDVIRFCLFCIKANRLWGREKMHFYVFSLLYCPSTFCDALWLFITLSDKKYFFIAIYC